MTTEQANSILVVDDDERLCNLIETYLSDYGYQVTVCHNGEAAVEHILASNPSLVVLDLMLPGIDGLTVCRMVRNEYHGQILMLTALDDTAEEITGLEIGADDYLTKPVSPRLLLARIRTLLRRQTTEHEDNKTQIRIDELLVDNANREASIKGELIKLTTAEFDLLWILVNQSGEAISRDNLHKTLFRIDLNPEDRRIDLLVSRLRKKLGDDPSNPYYLKTVRGRGYLMSKGR